MVVKTIRLHQVYNVEPVWLACLSVADSEVIPLSIASGIIVRLEDDIVLKFVNLDCSS